ncbi:MAG: cysteine desulfurase [Micavibrio sp.]|nr:cysteine desulfurase [Micavibrio sp.]|tara:strand:+ start:538 stop:1782 length:1245 start_codon:yes stop_codon:yes gene_type:complete
MAKLAAKNSNDMNEYKHDFPSLSHNQGGRVVTYLDSASSSQKPSCVIDLMTQTQRTHYANIHRGLYTWSQETTRLYEGTRAKVASFIGGAVNEVIFTKNATESINLIASSWGADNLTSEDEIILTEMEHHANIVPWQILQKRLGFKIKTIPVNADLELDLGAYEALLTPQVKLVSFVDISNATGVVNPSHQITEIAKKYNPDIKVLIDATQGVIHRLIHVRELGADFVVFTGHKLYGPTGVGVAWIKEDVLMTMPPYQGGGDMIDEVSFERTSFKDGVERFEAGTPAIIEVIGLGAAIDYITDRGREDIFKHELETFRYLNHRLRGIDGLVLYADKAERCAIASFNIAGCHASDVAMILDNDGVYTRTGHHCCMPLMKVLGVDATIRASLGLYSDKNDVDRLCNALEKAKRMLL